MRARTIISVIVLLVSICSTANAASINVQNGNNQNLFDHENDWKKLDPKSVNLIDFNKAEYAIVSGSSGSGGYFLDKDQIAWIREVMKSFKTRGISLPEAEDYDRRYMIGQSYYHLDDASPMAKKPQSIYFMNWQTEDDSSGKMSIRSRDGEFENYEVIFMVIASDGTKYKVARAVHGDEWASVRFPDDFNVTKSKILAGRYSWKAIVDRRVVLNGSFTLSAHN